MVKLKILGNKVQFKILVLYINVKIRVEGLNCMLGQASMNLSNVFLSIFVNVGAKYLA